MLKVDTITKDWKEAGSFPAQLNLYGFWDEHCFLTKTGDLGAVLKVGGIDYESLDHAGRDYAVKRLEAALRSLDDRTRLYQILFKRNHPEIPHAGYENPLVRAAVEGRTAFLQSKSDRLYSIEIFWVVTIDGSYRRTGLLHALAQFPKQPRYSLRDLHSLFSGNKERTLLYDQVERDRLRLRQKINSLSGQLSDLTTVELLGTEGTFRLVRRLVNFRPSRIADAPPCGARHLDWQVSGSELEAHRGYLRVDDDYIRVLTLKELPSDTRPLLLQGLLAIPANFHVVTEWHPVDNAKARKEIASRRRHHRYSKTSFVSNLQDRQNAGNQDNLVDDSKAAAVAELGSALSAMGMEGKSFAEFTLSVVVYDEDRLKVEHAVTEFKSYSRNMTACCMRNVTTCSMRSSPQCPAIDSSTSATVGAQFQLCRPVISVHGRQRVSRRPGPLQSATLQQVNQEKTLQTFLLDPSAPNIDVEIDAVVLEDIRQSPYRAQIEFQKVFRSPGDGTEQRRERWTANVLYGFRDQLPNAMLLTNPLGLIISYIHEDQAFGS